MDIGYLLQCLVKGEKMDFIIQKAADLELWYSFDWFKTMCYKLILKKEIKK